MANIDLKAGVFPGRLSSLIIDVSKDWGGYNITNFGTLNGVDISNHSARHDQGGADALSTVPDHDHSGDAGDGAQFSHGNLLNIGTNTHAQIDTHIGTGSIHFTEASISHLNIGGIGSNSHAQIDTHISGDGSDHSGVLLRDGSRTLTANWAVGDKEITGVAHLDLNDAGGQIRMATSPVFRISTTGKNFFAGYNIALSVSGLYNVGLGYDALKSMGNGNKNVAIGYDTGAALTTGDNHVFIGYFAGKSYTTSGNSICIGYLAGHIATVGGQVLVGSEAAASLTSGTGHVAIGYKAMQEVVTGVNNVVVGHQAGYALIGSNSVLIGAFAGYNATTSFNVIIGTHAGYAFNSGQQSVLIGYHAGYAVTHADPVGAIAIGYEAGTGSIGDYDVIIGYGACGVGMDDAGHNTIIGGYACENATDGKNNVIIGYKAAADCTADMRGCVLLGVNIGRTITSGMDNILMIDSADTETPLVYGEFNAAGRDNPLFRVYGKTESWSAHDTDVDNAEVWDTGFDGYHGLVILTIVTDDYCGLFHIENTTVTEIADPSAVFGTSAGADTYNIYYSGSNLVVQNNSGANNKEILVSLFGGQAT